MSEKHTSLPCPEDPTGSLLVAVELSFDELADVVSVGAVEAADRTAKFAVTAANVGRGCAVVVVCAVVSCSDTSTVKPEDSQYVSSVKLVLRRHTT